MRLDDDVRNAMCDAAVDLIDAGTGTAHLQLWSGSAPADPSTAPAGDLLAEFDLPDPAFGSASSGAASANGLTISTTGESAAGGGTTVGFARVVDQDGSGLWDDDDVGTSGNSIEVSSTTVSDGQSLDLTSWTFTVPAE